MIYTNGDSWSSFTSWTTEKQIWPQLVADRMGESLINQGLGCVSNSRIHNCLENFLIAGHQPKLVVIALTAHHRWHLPAADLGYWNIGPDVAIKEHTGEKDPYLHKWFWANSYNEIDSVYRYYKTIWNMNELCKKFNVPCMFFQAWEDDLEKLDLTNSANIVSYVSKYYDSNDIFYQRYVKGFEFLLNERHNWNYIETPTFNSFLQLRVDFDPTKHPNSQGHQKIADFVYQHIKEKNLV